MHPTNMKLFIIIVAVSASFGIAISDDSLKSAILLFQQGKYVEAKEIFTATVNKNPRNAEALYFLGRIAFVEEDWEASVAWLEKAVEVDERNSTYHMWLGRAYGRKAQEASIFGKASLAGRTKRAFEKAVSLDPDNVDARLYLMEFYRRAPEIVKEELEAVGTSALKSWAKSQTGLFVPLEPQLQVETAAILARYPELADLRSEHESADPWVIALAKLRGWTVVSQETSANEKRKPPKSYYIPDVYRDLGVPCINLLGLMRKEGWTF